MPLNRRRFLFASIAAGLVSASQRLLAAVVPTTFQNKHFFDTQQSTCFKVWVDTLLPADEVSPAASELGVPAQVLEKAIANPDYLRLIRTGCRWLNQQARQQGGQAFAGLDAPGRERIVRLAEQANAKSLPWAFFNYTRNDIFEFYYAQPQSWEMLDYKGPPQPLGFKNHEQPPAG